MDLDADERTPFLRHPEEGHKPAILPAVSRLKENGAVEFNSPLSEQQQTAFLILVHLYWYQSLFTSTASAEDIRTVWASARASINTANEIETRLLEIWTTYLDIFPSLSDVQSLLWSEFPLEHNSTRCAKVVDCLYSKHVPPTFLVHPVVQATMMATWKAGLRYYDRQRHHIWRRFDALTSPRYTTREIFMMAMAVTSLFAPWTLHSLSYIQVFLSFALTLPAEPLPGGLAFTSLHIALMVHVVSIHLPYPASIVYLLYPSISLPISTLLVQCANWVFLPLTVLFLPALLFASYLLSASLADTPWYHSSVINPVPVDTRTSFFLLFLLVVFTLLFSAAASLSTADMSFATSAEPWDRYTPPVGQLARKAFYRAVVRYTGHVFVPPFNALLLLVVIPSFLRFLLGYPRTQMMKEVQIFMWRLTATISLSSKYPMSKRRAGPQVAPTKKSRGSNIVPAFEAASEDDLLTAEPRQIPSASALSVRSLIQGGAIPMLTSLAARRFVENMLMLSSDERIWRYVRSWLKRLPDLMVPKLFNMLQESCPNVLSHGFIVLYFLRGPTFKLSNSLPGVQKQTIASITRNDGLRELCLIGFDKYPDSLFASLISSLPQLRILVLRGCTQISTKTADAAASCSALICVNLNYTTVTPVSLAGVLTLCPCLEVLKVAGIPSWLLDRLSCTPDIVFKNLRNLKLRQLSLSDASVQPFLARCPNLRRLDISFTHVRRHPFATNVNPSLEKISLTSINMQATDLIALVAMMPDLRTLAVGALGSGQSFSAAMGNSSVMNMTDESLARLTDVLEGFESLEKVSLVGNSKLGLTSRRGGALADFVQKVGRRCKHLNLSGLQHLRSRHLSGLMAEISGAGPPLLEELILNHTSIDDEAAPYLSCCSSLVSLKLVGAKITSTGLFPIIDACPRLEQLDLTSCRGIKVADRRRFFEVWEHEWKDQV
ncbi:RNI-like protein [Scleroderma citrinum]